MGVPAGCVEPIAASAGTVIAGVLCLLLSDLGSNRSLGPVAAIGIASALLGALTLLPALLLVFGKHSRILFWPRAPRPTPASPRPPSTRTSTRPSSPTLPTGRGCGRDWHGSSVARPGRCGSSRLLALAVGAAFLPTLNASGTNQVDIFLTDVDAVAGEEVLSEHFPAGSVQPAILIVERGRRRRGDHRGRGRRRRGVRDAVHGSPRRAPAGDAPPVVVDGRVRLDVATTASADTQAAVDTVEDVRTAVHEVSPSAVVGGAAAETLDTNLASERDLRVIVPVVLLVIGVILMFLLRSVVAAALLLAANVLSFAAALGVSAIFFNHVFGFAGADPVVPLFAFVFLVALGRRLLDLPDDPRPRGVAEGRHARGRGPRARRDRRCDHVGGGRAGHHVRGARVIPLLFLAQIAFIVAFGVLLDTLVVRSLLVPALVHDLGRRTWWPSALSRHHGARSAQGRPRPRVRRMEALRVGLVGYGGAGRGIHARLLREAGQRVPSWSPAAGRSRSRRTGRARSSSPTSRVSWRTPTSSTSW